MVAATITTRTTHAIVIMPLDTPGKPGRFNPVHGFL